MHLSRRDFVGLLGATALSASSTEPEIILINGVIHTMDPANPQAEAVAVANGRFLAVGMNAEISAYATSRTKRIDLGKFPVFPGFIDAHMHVAQSGLEHLQSVDTDLPSIAAIKDAIRKRASQTPAGNWVLGFKYDDTKMAEGRPINRQDLDEAAPNNPVYIQHRGGHTAFVNSAALNKADINDQTPNPAGGAYEHGADGKLTGRIMDNGNAAFRSKIPSTATRSDRRDGVKLITQMLVRAGVTSAHDALGNPDDLLAYQDAYEAGDLHARIYCLIGAPHIDKMIRAGIRTGLGNEWVRVGAMKLMLDGSISERTARLSQPYVGRPNDYGILIMGEDEMYTWARKAHLAGWQVASHANGDGTIDQALRVYERLQRETPRHDPRFRLEHCTVINDDLVRRIKAIGAIPTPFSSYAYYHGEKLSVYGEERVNRMFALRSFLDAGVRATQASDYTASPFDPMMALQSEVTRTDKNGNVWGPKQRITIQEALQVGTMNGAYASFEENLKGSITPGKLADLVVLGRDPLREDPSKLIGISVQRTMVGGKWMFEG
ncbi:MAG TPA: amidohydrolase [Bryobacteraceae bacterium]|jgi:predicted amidohydrolase YtcJ|nr:amidohydrolase [Bryobacteraceae bacterium]